MNKKNDLGPHTDGRNEDYDTFRQASTAVDQTVRFDVHPPKSGPLQIEVHPDHVLIQAPDPGTVIDVVYSTQGARIYARPRVSGGGVY